MMSPKTTFVPAVFSFVGRDAGTAADARSSVRWSSATFAGVVLPASWKTAVNDPSGLSPKCSSRASRTRSESVPGTLKVFERSGESLVLAYPPASSTTSHPARTRARWRSTKRVQAATTERLVGGVPFPTMAPRRDIDKLHEEIEELVADLWQVPRFAGTRRGFRPNIDSYHTDDPHELTVVVELPGVEPSSLELVVGERTLVISGER